jgi:hypothetical protein
MGKMKRRAVPAAPRKHADRASTKLPREGIAVTCCACASELYEATFCRILPCPHSVCARALRLAANVRQRLRVMPR